MSNKYDVIVIGSGAAGSVMAYNLARKNLKVAIIEKGKREDPQTFEHSEPDMFPRVYKQSGLQTTKDNNTTIAQGCTVGGSTVINNAIWLRADLDAILPEWAKAGAHIAKEDIVKQYEELEMALRITQIQKSQANVGSDVFLRGCKELGIAAEYLHNNRTDCLGCGWCNYGCRYNRKASMLITYIPWAEARGTQVFDACDDATIVLQNKRATGVRFVRNGKEEFLQSDKVVVSAGAIGSSAVLLGSGITLGGRVGKGMHLLGGVFINAETDEVLDGYDGIGLTCVAKASSDYVIESFFSPPIVYSLSLGGFFLTHFERMLNYTRYATGGVMVATEPTGVVTLDKKKNAVIDLGFSDRDIARLRDGMKQLSRIFFRGGANKVLPSTFKIIEFNSEDELDEMDKMIRKPEDLILGSAHPQGGNAMSEDVNKGVVGMDFRVHGYDNVYVADTSVFPTNIKANCQATAMAISQYASGFVAA